MHPQLNAHNNPLCAEVMEAFQRCHAEVGYWGRLTGACNEHKQQLDECFRAAKKGKRKALLVEARAERARWRAACEELDAKR